MDYRLKTPCGDCPFLREGGVRLRASRVRELAGMMLDVQGGTLACHCTVKTRGEDEDGEQLYDESNAAHCAGALLFAEKNGNETQMMRIAGRLRLYDPRELRGHERVFDTTKEMLATAVDGRKTCRTKTSRSRSKE